MISEVRDELGGAVWWAVAGVFGAWWVFVALQARRVRPRPVRPGPDALDLVGDESPAVVNLVTGAWSLGREALAATLLDLAARGYVSIRQSARGPVVDLPEHAEAATGFPGPVPGAAVGDRLGEYEEMVLERVRALAAPSNQRSVPVAAVLAGSPGQAKLWRARFRAAVHADAMVLGLARQRWSRERKLQLVAATAAPAFAVGFAFALEVTAATAEIALATVAYGGMCWAVLAYLVTTPLHGVADTAKGREVAARWLGLRATLAQDSRFIQQDPSGVEAWGRKLAYGAAMGLAPVAAGALPSRVDDDRSGWNPVRGIEPVVEVRYPSPLVADGAHPLAALLMGVAVVACVGLLAVGTGSLAGAVVPALVLFPLTGFALASGLCGLLDLVTPRRTVQGKVLRVERRLERKRFRWFVVVDDGTTRTVRPWRFTRPPEVGVDAVVRADVTRYLAHLRDFRVLEAGPHVPLVTDEAIADAVLESSYGAVWRGDDALIRAAEQATRRTGGLPFPNGEPPSFPDAAEARRVIERAVTLDAATVVSAQPAGESAHTVAYRVGNGLIQLTWMNPTAAERIRGAARLRYRVVAGIGDIAFRPFGGEGPVLARRGETALMVAAQLPDLSISDGNKVTAVLANHCLALATARSTTAGQDVDNPGQGDR